MNLRGVWAIYAFEMHRTRRTLMQSIAAPVISTALYFVVFGAAIGTRIAQIDGVSYGAFIVPGLVMLTLLTQSISNASFGIYFPRFTGTIYEFLSAPVSSFEIAVGFVGAAPPNRSSSASRSWRRPGSSCRCASRIRPGCSASCCSLP